MIAMKTPMAALRAHRQAGYVGRDVPAYLCLGGPDSQRSDQEPGRGPRVVRIEPAPRAAEQEAE